MSLSLNDLVTASGRYPDRLNSLELTDEVKLNLIKLLSKVNALLEAIGVNNPDVTSGFRPSTVNNKLANASKKSLHQKGMAVDLADSVGSLKEKCIQHSDKMRELGLFVEDPSSTPGWCHLDFGLRTDRPNRVFKP